MDYSLLLIIAKNDQTVQNLLANRQSDGSSFYFYTKAKNYILIMGLIDYLQIFNFQRNLQGKAQRFLQSLRKKPNSEISCVEPIAYHQRFNNGITKIFMVAQPPLPSQSVDCAGSMRQTPAAVFNPFYPSSNQETIGEEENSKGGQDIDGE